MKKKRNNIRKEIPNRYDYFMDDSIWCVIIIGMRTIFSVYVHEYRQTDRETKEEGDTYTTLVANGMPIYPQHLYVVLCEL